MRRSSSESLPQPLASRTRHRLHGAPERPTAVLVPCGRAPTGKSFPGTTRRSAAASRASGYGDQLGSVARQTQPILGRRPRPPLPQTSSAADTPAWANQAGAPPDNYSTCGRVRAVDYLLTRPDVIRAPRRRGTSGTGSSRSTSARARRPHPGRRRTVFITLAPDAHGERIAEPGTADSYSPVFPAIDHPRADAADITPAPGDCSSSEGLLAHGGNAQDIPRWRRSQARSDTDARSALTKSIHGHMYSPEN